MNRFSRLASTLFAASFSLSVLFAQPALAENNASDEIILKTEAVEQRGADLKAEIAKLQADIDVIDARIAQLAVRASAVANDLMQASAADRNVDRSQLNEEETIAQLAKDLADLQNAALLGNMHRHLEALSEYRATLDAEKKAAKAALAHMEALGSPRKEKKVSGPPKGSAAPKEDVHSMPVPPDPVGSPQAVTLVKQIVIDRHAPSLYRYWQRQDTSYKQMNPWGNKYCRSVTWHSVFKNVPVFVSGMECDSISWQKLLPDDSLIVPTGDVYAQVPPSVKAPTAITLAPTANAQLFKLDPSLPVVAFTERVVVEATQDDKVALANALDRVKWVSILSVYAAAVTLIMIFFAVKYLEERDAKRELESENAHLKWSLDQKFGIAGKSNSAGCCGTESEKNGCCEHRGPSDLCDPLDKK